MVVSLPKEERQAVGIDTDTDVVVDDKGDHLEIRPVEYVDAHRAKGDS